MTSDNRSSRTEFTFRYQGNRPAALILGIACIVLTVVAIRTTGGPWGGLAQATGVIALLLALQIDIRSGGDSA